MDQEANAAIVAQVQSAQAVHIAPQANTKDKCKFKTLRKRSVIYLVDTTPTIEFLLGISFSLEVGLLKIDLLDTISIIRQ